MKVLQNISGLLSLVNYLSQIFRLAVSVNGLNIGQIIVDHSQQILLNLYYSTMIGRVGVSRRICGVFGKKNFILTLLSSTRTLLTLVTCRFIRILEVSLRRFPLIS